MQRLIYDFYFHLESNFRFGASPRYRTLKPCPIRKTDLSLKLMKIFLSHNILYQYEWYEAEECY